MIHITKWLPDNDMYFERNPRCHNFFLLLLHCCSKCKNFKCPLFLRGTVHVHGHDYQMCRPCISPFTAANYIHHSTLYTMCTSTLPHNYRLFHSLGKGSLIASILAVCSALAQTAWAHSLGHLHACTCSYRHTCNMYM